MSNRHPNVKRLLGARHGRHAQYDKIDVKKVK
jgi:hypothetical protein